MMKIMLLGAPGAGKGTLSTFLCDKYHLLHISTGDLFRAQLQKDDDLTREIKEYVLSGQYVPDRITNQVASMAIDVALKEPLSEEVVEKQKENVELLFEIFKGIK